MVTHTGVRSYLLQYRMGGRGHPSQTITIGRHGSPWTAEKAREQAADLLELVRKGVDPKASKAEKRQQEEEARRD
ncbi:Arm DNA-binding domain-containing protein, partial [Salmonella sp. SAL00541]